MHRYSRVLTISRLLDKVGNDQSILRYLPDNPKSHVTQLFLYTILNTLDPSFIPNAQAEIDQMKINQKPKPQV